MTKRKRTKYYTENYRLSDTTLLKKILENVPRSMACSVNNNIVSPYISTYKLCIKKIIDNMLCQSIK